MFSCEHEALDYINKNKGSLLSELQEMEIRTIFTNEDTRINIMRNGKKLLKFINRYGNKEITDIFKEMIDLKLF